MGKKYNPESIPTSKVNPRGNYLVKILDLEETESAKGMYAVKGSFAAQEPKAMMGRRFSNWYQIGTKSDPGADDPKTFDNSWGATDLNNTLRNAGIQQGRDLSADLLKAKRCLVGITVTVKQRKDRETGELLEGSYDNQITDFWKPGTREPEVFEDASTKSAGAGERKPKPAKPVEEEDEEAADEAFSGDDDDDAKPAPTKKASELKGPAESSTKKVKKADTKTCPDCGESFPREQIVKHMQSCGEEEEDD